MKIRLINFILMIFWALIANGQMNTDSSKIVSVLSFNILHGETTKGDFNLDVIAQVIKDVDPDFVALQEVDFKTNRAKKYDLATELGWRTGLAPLFGKAMPYDGGEYGEGILSRFSFIKTNNHPLPASPDHEPRAALSAFCVLPSGDTICFVGTHFDHTEDETDRIMQAKTMNEVFSYNLYPIILAGDLNAFPGSETINILEEMWTATDIKEIPDFTYPSNNPDHKIDYIMFYPKNRWKVLSTEVICDSIASDHCAYLAELQLVDE